MRLLFRYGIYHCKYKLQIRVFANPTSFLDVIGKSFFPTLVQVCEEEEADELVKKEEPEDKTDS